VNWFLGWIGASRANFRLLRFYSLVSLIGVVVVVAILTFVMHRAAVDRMIEHETRASMTLARVFANQLWAKHAAFVTDASALPTDQLRRRPEVASLRTDVQSLVRGTNVVKVKLYNLDGLTVFSSDPAQIGESKRDNAGFRQARAGKPTSELTFRKRFSAFDGEIAERNLLSPYIPVRDAAAGEPVAVLEIYSDVTELLGRIEDERWRTSVTVGASLAVLYGFLFLIVRRAARMLQFKDRQLAQRLENVDQVNQKLSRANAFLEHTVAMQDRELRGALSEDPIAQGGGANAPIWSRAERRAVE